MTVSLVSRSLALVAVLSGGLQTARAVDAAQCRDDAMLVFDASRSMTNIGSDSGGLSRIDEARLALRRVLPQAAPFRDIGLVVYGPGRQDVCGHIDLRMAPTSDAAGRIMAELDGVVPDGDTPLTKAVARAISVLRAGEGRGTVVLVTDGRETCGGNPCRLANELKRTDPDLTVHVIGFKTLISSFEWQSFGKDDTRNTRIVARCLADWTGGRYAYARSTDDLVAALRDVLACPAVGRGEATAPPPQRS